MADSNKTRLLLALWALGGAKQEVKKGKLTKRIVPKGKKIADYQELFDQLKEENAIAVSKKGFSLVSPKGLEILSEGLKSPDFAFKGTIVGTWVANALLEWIKEIDSNANGERALQNQEVENDKSLSGDIASYEKFKEITLEVYEKLNRDEKLNNLVPVYQIRRQIGSRVNREYFDSWLLEMQANDILQLQGGSLPDNDPTKIKDSIETELSGLRCYAKLIDS
ncbi:MAG: hypothetical protein AAF915_25770 [Cyanobacteria bacterium P01_D01_bin.50]